MIKYLFALVLLSYGFTSCEKSTSGELPVEQGHQQQRLEILDGLEKAMGKLPDRTNLPPLNIQVTESLEENNYTRLTISFTAEENEIVPAYLYIPRHNGSRRNFRLCLSFMGQANRGSGWWMVKSKSQSCPC